MIIKQSSLNLLGFRYHESNKLYQSPLIIYIFGFKIKKNRLYYEKRSIYTYHFFFPEFVCKP